MQSIEYEKLAQVEHQMWWFRGLHDSFVSAFCQRCPKRFRGVILDAGCGTGGFLYRLAKILPEYGFDVDKTAREVAAKSGQLVCRCTIINGNKIVFVSTRCGPPWGIAEHIADYRYG